MPVLERDIRIRVVVRYGARRLVTNNWRWLIATVLGLGGRWLPGLRLCVEWQAPRLPQGRGTCRSHRVRVAVASTAAGERAPIGPRVISRHA